MEEQLAGRRQRPWNMYMGYRFDIEKLQSPQCTPFTRVLRTAAPPYLASTSSCTFSIDLKYRTA